MTEIKRAKVVSGYRGTRHESDVAFHDPSTVHGPDGAFVYGDGEFEIAVTPEVLDAVRHGRLKFVGASEEEPIPEEMVKMAVSASEGAELQAETQDEEAGKEPEKMKVEVDGETREGFAPTGTSSESFAAVPPTGSDEKAEGPKIAEVDSGPRKGRK